MFVTLLLTHLAAVVDTEVRGDTGGQSINPVALVGRAAVLGGGGHTGASDCVRGGDICDWYIRAHGWREVI